MDAEAGPGANARCPRCGAAFHCGAHEPAPCDCTRATLDARTLVTLRTRYEGCLCRDCLAAVSAEVAAQPAGTMPR